MGDLLLSAEQAIFLLGNLPLECDFIPGAVWFSRLCICVGKSHLYLAMESPSITELVLVKQEQGLWYLCVSRLKNSTENAGFAQSLLISDGRLWASLGITQQIAQELLDSSALSSWGLWKHLPRALALWLDLLTKRSWFQRLLQLPPWH